MPAVQLFQVVGNSSHNHVTFSDLISGPLNVSGKQELFRFRQCKRLQEEPAGLPVEQSAHVSIKMIHHPCGGGTAHNENEIFDSGTPIIPKPFKYRQKIGTGRIQPGHFIQENNMLLIPWQGFEIIAQDGEYFPPFLQFMMMFITFSMEFLNKTLDLKAFSFPVGARDFKSELMIENVIPKHLESMTSKLSETGIVFEEGDESLLVKRKTTELRPINIKTLPYPGFPTDMNPQTAVLLCCINGSSRINETIFNDRFRYVNELKRMGANIDVDNGIATIVGGQRLRAANVRAVDLRAGAAMILAGLVAEGSTSIEDIFYIERGYDNIVEKLSSIGASIKKVQIQDFS